VPDHRPSRLRSLSAVWRGHRHRCEPEGSEHFRNEVDQNYLKADSGDRNRFDPMNSTVDLSPSPCPIATERRIEMMDPNAGLNPFDPKRIHPKTLHPRIGANWSPIQIRPWIRLWNCPLPDLASPKDVRRLEGRLTCPSATNWKKKDWPCDQPTGPRPLP